MGGGHSAFVEIEMKYGAPGVDYIVQKHNERVAYLQTRDELQRINDHVNLQEKDDLEWLNQEKRQLEDALDAAHKEAEKLKTGLIAESEAKHKTSVRQFSGFNEASKKLDELEKRVKEQYKIEREKVKGKVDEEIKKHNTSTLRSLPEFDNKTDAAKKKIEEDCLRKYPSKASKATGVDIERNLRWDNFRPTFAAILNKEQVGLHNLETRNRVKNNVVPTKAPVCC